MLSKVTNPTSLSGKPMDESGFGGCQENLSGCIVPSVKLGGVRIMVRDFRGLA